MSEANLSANSNNQATPSPKTPSTSARRLILFALMTYLMFLAPLTYFQRSLIYHPQTCNRLEARQSGLPQAVVDVTVKSDDGLDLHGWLALAGTSPGSDSIDAKSVLSEGRPVVLFFSGNAGNRSMRYAQMMVIGSLNAHTLLVDYRGYADNAGKPTEEDLAHDARSVWNYLTQELGVPDYRIVIYGESLGGGVATRLASELSQEGIEPGGLIIQSTFSSLVDVAQHHFPIIPVSWLLVDRYPSARRIPQVTCPILSIHGEDDSIVPFVFGQRLFDAAPSKSSRGIAKRQFVMPNTDHNDVYSDAWDKNSQLVTELKSFLDNAAIVPDRVWSGPNENKSPRSNTPANATWIQSIDLTIVISVGIVILAVIVWWVFRTKPALKP